MELTPYLISPSAEETIRQAWWSLSEQQRHVLVRRASSDTFREISGVLGVTRQRVQQIYASAQTKLRKNTARLQPNFFQSHAGSYGPLGELNLAESIEGFVDKSVAKIALPEILATNGYASLCEESEWWLLHRDKAVAELSELQFQEPLSQREWEAHIDTLKLSMRILSDRTTLKFAHLDYFEGYLINMKQARKQRAHVLLLLHDRLSASEMCSLLGEPSKRALDAFLARHSIFIKLRPSGLWALSDRAENVYVTAIEAVLDVLTNEGPLTRVDLIKRVQSVFDVSHGRIDQCLTDYRIGKLGDGSIDLIERGAEKEVEPEPNCPSSISSSGAIVGVRRRVDKDTIRGSGLMESRWLAWKLGLHSTPMKRIFDGKGNLPSIYVSRAGGNSQISSLREPVENLGLNLGDEFVLMLDIESDTWQLRAL